MRYLLGLFLLCLPSVAWAQTDTFGCLNQLSGPINDVAGTSYVENDWFGVANGTRFDARGDAFTAQTLIDDSTKSKYPIDIRSSLSTVCWAGGSVVYTDDANATWKQRHDMNSAGVMGYDTNLIADGVRVHNAEDSFRPFWTRDGATVSWQVRNSWASYNRDDCIEADWPANGTVTDNLFDGCYVFFSATWGDSPQKTFTMENNLVRLQKMPGPNGWNDPKYSGHGDLFKTRGAGPRFILKNNVFLVDGYSTTSWNVDGQPDNSATTLAFKNLDGCSGNVIVWIPPANDPTAPFPGTIPNDPSCVTVTTDVSVWNTARDNWLVNHPNVMRISGVDDPVIVASNTDSSTTLRTTSTTSTTSTSSSSSTTDSQDTQAPDVTFLSPGKLVQRKSDQVIEVAATDNVGVLRVEISINGKPYAVLQDTWTVDWTVPDVKFGSYDISATAIDLSGNYSTQSIKVFAW